ncbi:MAG: hypothetical protein IKU19_06970 [Clostridia bacterium]|nr:hypothetical protein [Clostridia bacterium]
MKKIAFLFITITFLLLSAVAVCADQYGFSVDVDVEGLVQRLEDGAVEDDYIDISDFNIPASDEAALDMLCRDAAPMLFHFDRLVPYVKKGYIKEVLITSLYSTHQEYLDKRKACTDKAAELLEGVKDNDSLDDVTKALILHDRLLVACRYDKDGVETETLSQNASEICGPFIDGKTVCTGYISAYQYLLRQIGIESRFVRSQDMNHVWLIAKINGKEYHIDPTYNDAVPDVTGRISHDYFLVSTNKLTSMGETTGQYHGNYTDWQTADNTPNNTEYDD